MYFICSKKGFQKFRNIEIRVEIKFIFVCKRMMLGLKNQIKIIVYLIINLEIVILYFVLEKNFFIENIILNCYNIGVNF